MAFKDKHVWIIGASSGIGSALAIELDRRGARLTLSARRADALTDLRSVLEGRPFVRPLDVTNLSDFHEAAQSDFDCAILLAGEYAPSSFADMDLAAARKIVDVNLLGALHFISAVFPAFRQKKRGQVVFCGSVAGYRGLPNAQPYAATKSAIISLAETARIEEGRHGIDVRLINPGFVRTPMTEKNVFPMPMMISAAAAARAIADGLEGGAFEIHFPRRFTLLMKVLRLLPDALYFRLMDLL